MTGLTGLTARGGGPVTTKLKARLRAGPLPTRDYKEVARNKSSLINAIGRLRERGWVIDTVEEDPAGRTGLWTPYLPCMYVLRSEPPISRPDAPAP